MRTRRVSREPQRQSLYHVRTGFHVFCEFRSSELGGDKASLSKGGEEEEGARSSVHPRKSLDGGKEERKGSLVIYIYAT
jgi:hypothetical protein